MRWWRKNIEDVPDKPHWHSCVKTTEFFAMKLKAMHCAEITKPTWEDPFLLGCKTTSLVTGLAFVGLQVVVVSSFSFGST